MINKLKKEDINYLFNLINDDLKAYGKGVRLGQSIMNNLRVISYDIYYFLTNDIDDPFYIDENIPKAFKKVVEKEDYNYAIVKLSEAEIKRKNYAIKI